MENSNFDQLLQRYLTGKVSEDERIKIEAWLEVMKTEDNANLTLDSEDEEKLFQKITSRIEGTREVADLTRRLTKDHGQRSWVLRIAATLLIVAITTFAVWWAVDERSPRLEARSGSKIEKLILYDGSLVWLKENSHLVYYEKKEETGTVTRVTELEGEGLFEVARDAARPFIVQCGEVRFRVVGTSFNISRMDDRVILNVLTGSVNVSSTATGLTATVARDEQVTCWRDGRLERLALHENVVENVVAGTTYDMRFTNERMGEVFDRLGDKFDVKIIPVKEQAAKCRLTADLTDHSLAQSLEIIAEVLDFKFTRNGDVITVAGSCQ